MFEKPPFSDFLKQASQLMPESAASVRAEFERNLHPLLEKQLGNFNLVTREEFTTQLALFERLTDRVSELETELKVLKASQKEPQKK